MKKKFISSFLLIYLLISISFSQEARFIGLSGSVQSNQFGILLPMWLEERFVLAPAFDFKFAENIGTEFSIGIIPRWYFNDEMFAPYFGLKIGTIINIPSSKNEIDTDTKADIIGGVAFGVEYFLTEKFSFGVEAQGNITKSDKYSSRFGNPDGININTATMISATVYF